MDWQTWNKDFGTEYEAKCKAITDAIDQLDAFLVTKPAPTLAGLTPLKFTRDHLEYIIMGYHMKALGNTSAEEYINVNSKVPEHITTADRTHGLDKSTSSSAPKKTRAKKKTSGPIPRTPRQDGGKLAGIDLNTLTL